MFKKVLIANRGEIAVRIIQALKELDIPAAIIFSEADRESLPVRLADEAYSMKNLSPRESYLNIEEIIKVAKKCKADAIHPGYGFLAERHEFAKRCQEEKITFIGPSWETIKSLGDKNNARRMAQKLQIPIIPGSTDCVYNLSDALKLAPEIGYPLIIKASHGGGGRGMRLVERCEKLQEIFHSAQSESEKAFASKALYLEKYLSCPRHIEFQIMADNSGGVIHLGERECSIQRRFQKIIEEAPSSFLDEELRNKMGKAATAIARSIGYTNLGTVEFLVDKNKNFYFLEVNTRIQVEHTVTEEITGIDLLKEQLRLARGENLQYSQEDIKINGWAFECRITCENPFDNFIPAPGKVTNLRFPQGKGVRIESALYPGYIIPKDYDSLIAKLISKGRDRQEAMAKMLRALSEFDIGGVHTTIPFHLKVFTHPEFVRGNLSTHFIENYFSGFKMDAPHEYEEIAALIAVIEFQRIKERKMPRDGNNGFDKDKYPWKTAARLGSLRT